MKDILVITLGESTGVLWEAIHFLAGEEKEFYSEKEVAAHIKEEREKYRLGLPAQCWAITSDGIPEDDIKRIVSRWSDEKICADISLKIARIHNTGRLESKEQNEIMTEGIYRIVWAAKRERQRLKNEMKGQGDSFSEPRLIFSLAGGRKTMSSALQQAGNDLGMNLMFHIVDFKINGGRGYRPFVFFDESGDESTGNIFTLLSREEKKKIDQLTDWLLSKHDGEHGENIHILDIVIGKDEKTLIGLIENKRREIGNISHAFFTNLIKEEKYENFRSLYRLKRAEIETLRETFIGRDAKMQEEEIEWLRALPKAELHMHFGGIADSAGLKKIAGAIMTEMSGNISFNEPEKDKTFRELTDMLSKGKVFEIRKELDLEREPGNLKRALNDIARRTCLPLYAVAAKFILSGSTEHLEKLIHGDGVSHGIGLVNYCALGDLGGSTLLRTERALETNVDLVYDYAVRENIKYMEVRCSPAKYSSTYGNSQEDYDRKKFPELSVEKVIEIIKKQFRKRINECSREKRCIIKLIAITTRPRGNDPNEIKKAEADIKAAEILFDNEPFSSNLSEDLIVDIKEPSLVGCDLAGDENQPFDSRLFREKFRSLFRKCLKFTIHAGEARNWDAIWDAIYELNADRVGHGLTLRENKRLMNYMSDRGIAVELCPTSNYQTYGFKLYDTDGRCEGGWKNSSNIYPLKELFNAGIMVTINTDNPGISRTSLSKEFIMAARMTEGGISRWDVLAIIKSSFKNAFLHHSQVTDMIKEIDDEIFKIVSCNLRK